MYRGRYKGANITIIGAGYVGLVTGACFATKENHVTIVEKDRSRIKALYNKKIPFYEPGLDDIVTRAAEQKYLAFTDNIADALKANPDFIFLCVGTPSMPDGSADLSFIKQAAYEIGLNLQRYAVIITKSTVPVGTSELVRQEVLHSFDHRGFCVPFDVASNPEFLKEGNAIKDFFEPDRVVIGADSTQVHELLTALYLPFVKHKKKIICMNIASSELTKYAANGMLATRISFMNQIAQLADKVGADVEAIREGIGTDVRIGPQFLKAGIGYGGSCFPKDIKALADMGKQFNHRMTLVEEVDAVNNSQRRLFSDRILAYYWGNLTGKTIGIWGLAFKPETDDVRDSPSIDVVKALLAAGATVVCHDPVASSNMKKLLESKKIYGTYHFVKSPVDILHNADSLVIMTDWKQYNKFPASAFSSLRDKTVFDGRNMFEPSTMEKNGVTYVSIGRNILGGSRDDGPPHAPHLHSDSVLVPASGGTAQRRGYYHLRKKKLEIVATHRFTVQPSPTI